MKDTKDIKKKTSLRIYVAFAVVLIICGLIGGIAGYVALANGLSLYDLSQKINHLLSVPGPWWFLPGFLLFAISTHLYIQGKRLLPKAIEDDEVFPRANLSLSRAMFLANLSSVIMFLSMALSYAASWGIGLSALLLLLQVIWGMVIQARVVSAIKQLFPEKRGNIFDLNFQRDWYQSCDEAEQQQIGQCSYQTFKVMNLIFPAVMAALAILSTIRLIAPTYSLLVGGLWLVQQFVYNYTSLQMDKKNVRGDDK